VDRGSLERVLSLDAHVLFRLLRSGSLARGDWYQGRDELDLLSQVRCPVLAVRGEEDDFLPAHRHAAWSKPNVEAAGNHEVTCRVLAGHYRSADLA
jgi:pimeloyl-ACP methyl ester carboxylesterase